jgi:hypothetical protein
MLSEEVGRQFAERGIQTIAPEAGTRAFEKELRLGKKSETRIVLGGGPWEISAIKRY